MRTSCGGWGTTCGAGVAPVTNSHSGQELTPRSLAKSRRPRRLYTGPTANGDQKLVGNQKTTL